MQRTLFQELQKRAELAKNSKSIEEGIEHLSSAFALFSEEKSFLIHRQEELKKELRATKENLMEKVAQLNMITDFLSSILKHISQGILFINVEGVVLCCNEAAESLLQLKAESLLYKKFWTHFPDNFFGFSLRDALNYGVAQSLYYITLPHKEDRERELEIFTSFILEGNPQHHGIILLLRDITEIHKWQKIAARNDRMKQLGEMISTVTHEIKNPLGGIKGYSTLLQRDLEGTPQAEMVQYILDGTKTLENFVSKVLLYARPVEVQPTSTDMAIFLRKLKKFLTVDPSFPSNVILEIHISEEPFFAPIDPNALKSALINLIMNAYQAMPEGGKITLTLLKQNQNLLLTVSDTGCGIPEDKLEKIFTPFFTTKTEGNGLGLPETFRIIQAHFGQIEVRSKVEQGTTFSIKLPLKR